MHILILIISVLCILNILKGAWVHNRKFKSVTFIHSFFWLFLRLYECMHYVHISCIDLFMCENERLIVVTITSHSFSFMKDDIMREACKLDTWESTPIQLSLHKVFPVVK